jgi:F0F1-type ATP synthase assembly protein I
MFWSVDKNLFLTKFLCFTTLPPALEMVAVNWSGGDLHEAALCAKCHKVLLRSIVMAKQDDTNLGKLAAMGLELAVGVALGAVVGNWLDRKYHWDPWGTLIGTAIGFCSGMYLLVKESIAANKK